MQYTLNVYGQKTKFKKDDRFSKKGNWSTASDTRINKKSVARRLTGRNKGIFSRMSLKQKVYIAITLLILGYFCTTLRIQTHPFSKSETPVAHADDNPLPEFPKDFVSADMPKDYVEPQVAETNAFNQLVSNESEKEAGRINPDSLACGIGQAYPCTKLYTYATKSWILKNKVVVNGNWYLPNPDRQYEINWTFDYIAQRYGNAVNALTFWETTSVKLTGKHWY